MSNQLIDVCDERMRTHIEEANNYMVARRVLADIDWPDVTETCYAPSMYVYLIGTVPAISLHVAIKSHVAWRDAMQAVHVIRRALGITRVTRRASGASQTYSGRNDQSPRCIIDVEMSTSALPPSCTIEYVTETRDVRIAKMVCAS